MVSIDYKVLLPALGIFFIMVLVFVFQGGPLTGRVVAVEEKGTYWNILLVITVIFVLAIFILYALRRR